MKYVRFLVGDIRKNVLTEGFLWGICIVLAFEIFVLGVALDRIVLPSSR